MYNMKTFYAETKLSLLELLKNARKLGYPNTVDFTVAFENPLNSKPGLLIFRYQYSVPITYSEVILNDPETPLGWKNTPKTIAYRVKELTSDNNVIYHYFIEQVSKEHETTNIIISEHAMEVMTDEQ